MKFDCNLSLVCILVLVCCVCIGCDQMGKPMMNMVVEEDPQKPQMPTETETDDGMTEPDIVVIKLELEFPVFETSQAAIEDEDVKEKIDYTITWITKNCTKTLAEGPPPRWIRILFTSREERQKFVDYLHTVQKEWTVFDRKIHVVEDTNYYFLEVIVKHAPARQYENCIEFVEN